MVDTHLPMSLQPFARISTDHCLIGLAVMATIMVFLHKTRWVVLTFGNGVPLPPGPPARWFWEKALPPANVPHIFADWVTQYGPVVTVRRGSDIIIVVGRVDAVAEIMEKEGGAVADRPRSVSVGEIMYEGLSFLLLRNGERLRRFRRTVHANLQLKAVGTYQDIQLGCAKTIITDILNDPKNFIAHIRQFSVSVILRLTYGPSTPTANDHPEVARIWQAMENFSTAMRPGAYLVDRIPLLRYIPGYGRQLKEFRKFELQLYRDQMNRILSDIEANRAGNSFTRTLLEHSHEYKLSNDEMAYLAGNLNGAGSETSAVSVKTMILASARYPEAQKRVQDELDTVIGKDRLPTWEDSEALPQVHAFILEALRWRPVVPIGFAHRATRDIIWRGYCIPAGATVYGCHWAISHDPVAFPEPEKFDPQRWIDEHGKLRTNMTAYPFGFGRRICPGRHLANRSMYMSLALLLWSFRIVEIPDKPINERDYTDTVVSHASPFEVEFIPRIEEDQLKEMMTVM